MAEYFYPPSASGSGITQLTGDVEAGPGSGSEVATITAGAVTETKIADSAVATAKIQDLAVTNAKVAAGIDAVKIGDGTVSNTEFGYLNNLTSGIQQQLNFKQSTTEKGVANGYASLNSSGKIPNAQIPAIAITETFVVASEAAMLALSTAEEGDVAVRTDINKSFILADTDPAILANWQELLTPTDAVLSVNGQTGIVVLDTADVAEDTNLYFTDERAQDAVGTILTDSSSVDLTYDDGAGTITAAVIPGGIDKNTLGGSALAVDQGGTGQTTANAALNALLPAQTSNGGKVLGTDGTDTSWLSVLTNPMDSAGDLIYGGASGAATKLDAGSSGQVLIAQGAASPSWNTLSGDVTISSSGVTAIGSGVIVNADINASAAIAGTKIDAATASVRGAVAPRKGQTGMGVTGSMAGWSTIRAVGIYYQDQDGNHRLKFNIAGTCTSASQNAVTLTITGVVFKNLTNYNQPISAIPFNAIGVAARAYANPNTADILIQIPTTASITGWAASGDVELESAPSWA